MELPQVELWETKAPWYHTSGSPEVGEGLANAWNILYNDPFIDLSELMGADAWDRTQLTPEEICIQNEEYCEEELKAKGLSQRAIQLIRWCLGHESLYSKGKTALLKVAKEELHWSWTILTNAATEVEMFVRFS